MEEKGARRQVFKNDLQGMLLPVLIISIIGSFNIFSATYVDSITNDAGLLGYFPKHLLFLGLSVFVGGLLYRFDYRKLQKRHILQRIMMATLASLVLVLLVGSVVNGARRWIPVGAFSVQPSEFAKLAAIIWTSAKIAEKPWKNPKFKSLLEPIRGATMADVLKGYFKERGKHMFTTLVWPTIFAVLIMKQPDMGTAVLTVGFSYLLIFLAGFDKVFFSASLIIAGIGGFILAKSADYRWARVMSWLDPWSQARDSGYQTVQGLLAVGSGGLLGQGFLNGTSKYFYLPEAHTDFAFAVWAQEMGLIGALAVLFFIAMFTYFGFRIANKARDEFGKWLAIGITVLISGQAFFNIAMVCGMLPVTGVPLPFISYGGSSLLMNYMAIGILANIARRSVEGVKNIGTKEPLPSLREETQSRFKPERQAESKMPGRFVPPPSKRVTPS